MSNINNVAAMIYTNRNANSANETTSSFRACIDALTSWRSAGRQAYIEEFIRSCDWQNVPVLRIFDTVGNLRVGAFMGTMWNDSKEITESWWILSDDFVVRSAPDNKIKISIFVIRDDGTKEMIPLSYFANGVDTIGINKRILERWALSIGKTRIEYEEARQNYVNDFLENK